MRYARQSHSATFIKDGDIIEQNLVQNNLDIDWLRKELREQGIDDPRDVVLAVLQTDGTLYVDRRDDNLSYVQRVED